jgi:hypothetical protein
MDTIVAVLVVVSVLSMAIFIVFNNGCRGSNDAHEPRAAAAGRAANFPRE